MDGCSVNLWMNAVPTISRHYAANDQRVFVEAAISVRDRSLESAPWRRWALLGAEWWALLCTWFPRTCDMVGVMLAAHTQDVPHGPSRHDDRQPELPAEYHPLCEVHLFTSHHFWGVAPPVPIVYGERVASPPAPSPLR